MASRRPRAASRAGSLGRPRGGLGRLRPTENLPHFGLTHPLPLLCRFGRPQVQAREPLFRARRIFAHENDFRVLLAALEPPGHHAAGPPAALVVRKSPCLHPRRLRLVTPCVLHTTSSNVLLQGLPDRLPSARVGATPVPPRNAVDWGSRATIVHVVRYYASGS